MKKPQRDIPPSNALLALRQRRVALCVDAAKAYMAWEKMVAGVKTEERETRRRVAISADLVYQGAVSAERDQCEAEGVIDHFGNRKWKRDAEGNPMMPESWAVVDKSR